MIDFFLDVQPLCTGSNSGPGFGATQYFSFMGPLLNNDLVWSLITIIWL